MNSSSLLSYLWVRLYLLLFYSLTIVLGSVKLKSYTGRSLFNGLLSAPAVRKRAGLTEVLDAFPESKFILVGDSGEQDLELYSAVAAERPGQVLAVFRARPSRGSGKEGAFVRSCARNLHARTLYCSTVGGYVLRPSLSRCGSRSVP